MKHLPFGIKELAEFMVDEVVDRIVQENTIGKQLPKHNCPQGGYIEDWQFSQMDLIVKDAHH